MRGVGLAKSKKGRLIGEFRLGERGDVVLVMGAASKEYDESSL